jgi:hypothetical protein
LQPRAPDRLPTEPASRSRSRSCVAVDICWAVPAPLAAGEISIARERPLVVHLMLSRVALPCERHARLTRRADEDETPLNTLAQRGRADDGAPRGVLTCAGRVTRLSRGSTSTQGHRATRGVDHIGASRASAHHPRRASAAHLTAHRGFGVCPGASGLHLIGEACCAGCGAQVDLFLPEGCQLLAVYPESRRSGRSPPPGSALPKQNQSRRESRP